MQQAWPKPSIKLIFTLGLFIFDILCELLEISSVSAENILDNNCYVRTLLIAFGAWACCPEMVAARLKHDMHGLMAISDWGGRCLPERYIGEWIVVLSRTLDGSRILTVLRTRFLRKRRDYRDLPASPFPTLKGSSFVDDGTPDLNGLAVGCSVQHRKRNEHEPICDRFFGCNYHVFHWCCVCLWSGWEFLRVQCFPHP